MRTFEVRREQAVERAVERIRHGVGATWEALSPQEASDLAWLLGQLWSLESRAEWDSLHFSKLTPDDLVELARIARRLLDDPHDIVKSMRDASTLIRRRNAS